ncbi:hypothetical membrane protein, conserved [Thermococcus chitonophagus]|nr:hypothetical membrane protein, conserved [Thermococcus chitonophagus]
MGHMAIFGLGVFAFIVAFILYLAVEAVFIYGGAKLAGIEGASFGKAFIAALALLILMPIFGFIFGIVFAFVPIIGHILALLLTFLAGLWIIKVVFSTSWIKAFITAIFAFILAILVAFFLAVLFGLSLFALL